MSSQPEVQKLHPLRIAVYIIAAMAALSAVLGGYAVSSYRLDASEEVNVAQTTELKVHDVRLYAIEKNAGEQKIILVQIKETTDALLEREQ